MLSTHDSEVPSATLLSLAVLVNQLTRLGPNTISDFLGSIKWLILFVLVSTHGSIVLSDPTFPYLKFSHLPIH